MPTPLIRNTVVLQPRRSKGRFALDEIPGSVAAYSLRRLRMAYTGNAIRVRRSSDNAEQDIGFTSSGALDTTALTAFIGANSGYVAKWYDQSGNNYDIAQTAAVNQLIIVSNGSINLGSTNKTSIKSEGTSKGFNQLTLPVYITSNTLTANFVGQSGTYAANGAKFYTVQKDTNQDYNGAGGANLFERNSASSIKTMKAGTTLSSITISENIHLIATTIFDGAKNITYKDGVASNAVNITIGFDFNRMNVFRDTGGLRSETGQMISEIIIFNLSLSETNRTKLESNQKSYYSIT